MIKIPVSFLFLLFTTLTLGQSPTQQSPGKLLEAFYSENYQESVFIHTDKSYYLTGETIKLSVYCIETLTNRPSRLSRVAYADIVDGAKNTILTARIELNNGAGSGEIYIPTSVTSGYVALRGYTRWMRNYGPEMFFHSVLTIINPFRRLPTLSNPGNKTPLLSFFPEGGVLLEGEPTHIVFHGKSATGNFLDFKGELLSADSAVVLTFQPASHGLGSFQFAPEAGKDYFVRLHLPDSTIFYHSFPKATAKGASVRVQEHEDSYTVTIINNASTDDASFQLFVHQGERVISTENIQIAGVFSKELKKSAITSGVFYITLLRDTRILSQRVICHLPDEYEDYNLLTARTIGKRDVVSIRLDALDNSADDYPVYASVSAAPVTPPFLPATLAMNQWAFLRNAIAQPFGLGTYLKVEPADLKNVINDLLIAYPNTTAGSLFLNASYATKYLAESRGMLVTGRVTDKNSSLPVLGINTYLSVPGRNSLFFASQSKRDGSLAFELQNVYGENEIVVMTDYTKDTTYRIEIDNPFSSEYMDISLPEFTLDESIEDWLAAKSQQMQVLNATQKYNPTKPSITEIDSSAFYAKPDASYMLDDYTRFIVMEEVMREYIAGVNVRKNKDGFHFMVVDMEKNIVYPENPLILLDGVPIFDADDIIAVDPLKIQRIQTINRRYGRGIVDCYGIVNYTSYKGNLGGYSLRPGTLAFRYDGLQVPRRAAPITYSDNDKNTRTPDFRNTLLWIPIDTAGKLTQASLEFYTSDVIGDYEVVVNALSNDGRIITLKDTLRVR